MTVICNVSSSTTFRGSGYCNLHPHSRKEDLGSTSLIVWSSTIEAMAQKATRSSIRTKQVESNTTSVKEHAILESRIAGENTNFIDDEVGLATDSTTPVEVTLNQRPTETGNFVSLMDILQLMQLQEEEGFRDNTARCGEEKAQEALRHKEWLEVET